MSFWNLKLGTDMKALFTVIEIKLCTMHPEGTSIGSDNCDFSKNSDNNGCLWNINFLSLKPH